MIQQLFIVASHPTTRFANPKPSEFNHYELSIIKFINAETNNHLYMLILPWLANSFNNLDLKLPHRKLQTNVRKFPLPRKKLSSCLSTVTLFHVYVIVSLFEQSIFQIYCGQRLPKLKPLEIVLFILTTAQTAKKKSKLLVFHLKSKISKIMARCCGSFDANLTGLTSHSSRFPAQTQYEERRIAGLNILGQ